MGKHMNNVLILLYDYGENNLRLFKWLRSCNDCMLSCRCLGLGQTPLICETEPSEI